MNIRGSITTTLSLSLVLLAGACKGDNNTSNEGQGTASETASRSNGCTVDEDCCEGLCLAGGYCGILTD